MVPVFAVTAVLSMQAAGAAPSPPQSSVRVWRTDSTAYVALRRPGHLLLMHVDAIGRIQVLYPLTPDDTFTVSSDAPAAISLPPTAEGNPGTFLAVRSRWAFDFSSVQLGSWWNYPDALLLQPTAGDPLAALLEIADRVTDGRPYDYAEATYSRDGDMLARGPVEPPQVCWTCVRQRPPVTTVAAAATNSADCTNATLTNSFCGVATAPVTIASAPPAQPAPMAYQQEPQATIYYAYPYYFWSVDGGRRLGPPSPPVTPRSQGVASPVGPRVVVPRGRNR